MEAVNSVLFVCKKLKKAVGVKDDFSDIKPQIIVIRLIIQVYVTGFVFCGSFIC